MYLGNNALSGEIPNSVGYNENLEILSAQANKLSGTIASSISKLSALQVLDLSYNKLSGLISDELSYLPELKEIRLNNNRFSGFPKWISSMRNLKVVLLNNNLLDGKVYLPLEFADLLNLEQFAIDNNDLTGEIPDFVCDLVLDARNAFKYLYISLQYYLRRLSECYYCMQYARLTFFTQMAPQGLSIPSTFVFALLLSSGCLKGADYP